METNNSNPFDFSSPSEKEEEVVIKLFSDELLKLRGKIVELYIGEQSETINYDEISVPQNSSIFGKIIDVLDRFVVLQCLYVENREVRLGNKIYINTFQIRAMTELDGHGSLQDIFLNVKDAKFIRDLIKKQGL